MRANAMAKMRVHPKDEEQDHGRAQQRDPRASATEQDREHGDSCHHRGADDAGLGRDEDDEADKRTETGNDADPAPSPSGQSLCPWTSGSFATRLEGLPSTEGSEPGLLKRSLR